MSWPTIPVTFDRPVPVTVQGTTPAVQPVSRYKSIPFEFDNAHTMGYHTWTVPSNVYWVIDSVTIFCTTGYSATLYNTIAVVLESDAFEPVGIGTRLLMFEQSGPIGNGGWITMTLSPGSTSGDTYANVSAFPRLICKRNITNTLSSGQTITIYLDGTPGMLSGRISYYEVSV
jgi:hypothetical protein